jgi:hypothetical protein
MLSHPIYKTVHLLGIFLLVCGLGGLWAMAAAATDESRRAARELVLATHGAAMFLILFAGFGMLARLGITGSWPLWIWIKVVIWVLLGALPVLLRKADRPVKALFFLAPVLGAIAAWAAVFHIGQAP